MILSYQHLLGREHIPGEQDCFTLVRDFYADNFGIVIRNYARPHDWDADQLDIIDAAYEREGFLKLYDWKLRDLRPGDVLCMAIGAGNANHFAIYVGDNTLVHHRMGLASSAEAMREFWRRSTVYVVRHPDVPDLTPTRTDVTIQELSDARNRIDA